MTVEPGRSGENWDDMPRIAAGDSFDFACAGCGGCCRGRRDLVLSGYDLYRIARRFGVRRDNLAGVGVISGDYDQRVAILFSEFQRTLYGFIEIDRLANLPTRIRSVILFIDGCTFNLQEKAFLIFTQQFNGFVGHLRQGRYAVITLRIRRTGNCGLVDIAVVRCFRS